MGTSLVMFSLVFPPLGNASRCRCFKMLTEKAPKQHKEKEKLRRKKNHDLSVRATEQMKSKQVSKIMTGKPDLYGGAGPPGWPLMLGVQSQPS